MSKDSSDIKCSHCGEPLPESHRGPCPKCGKEGETIDVSITEDIVLSDSVGWQTTKEFYEKNHKALAAIIVITILSSFVGLFIVGVPGVVIGLFFGFMAYFLGPKAVIKVREIRSG